ncbi:nucleotide exchange factor GrpE [Catalinimonas niigatensis]|uniref:nucleotide exchange factor GrpE n=1 Tax=Catalinimonas niigatensis TaxID=1397264 RepID=UPI00266601A0|nr:nucleotide exchange factor GrpE [Catalinimonas niigatensis]WPP50106.1 nucleotide exchange factor GrpE [Catalinimonas niigatensis]
MAHNESEEKNQQTGTTAEESMKDQPTMENKDTHPIDEEADKASDQNLDTDDTTEQEDALRKLEGELSDAKDKYLRLYAEFENYRKRTSKERLELVKTANEELILDLLTVLDDLERSLQIFENKDEVAPMYEGIKLVSQKFNNVLTRKGLKLMEVGPGSDFDSDYHEAVAQVPAPEDALKGKIVDVLDKGYFLGEKVLRYAKVVIGQ